MTVSLGVTLFNVVLWIYLLASVCYVWNLIRSGNVIGKVATAALGAGWVVHTAALVVRTVAAGRPPFLNLYEYALSLTWGFVLVYLVVEFISRNRQIGGFIVPLVTLFAYKAAQMSSEVNPTMPALNSPWRVPHIATAILAYSAFGLAFGLAIMYLIRERAHGSDKSFWAKRLPPAKVLDDLVYRTLAFGFLMQTALLVTGALWAQSSWGRYWSWDPKETWALITWLIYATFLHMRRTRGWRGRTTAIMCILGFVITMFTLFGVTYLMSGLHSYA